MKFRFFFSVMALLFSAFVFAQDFEVSPVLINFNADPGETQKRQINIINHSNQPQKYVLKISDFMPDKEGNRKVVPAGTNKRSCADWLTISPSFIELNPNQSAALDVMMTVPKDGFGARWCMAHVQVGKEQSAFDADKNLAAGVMLVPRIAIVIRQAPKSNNSYKATINNLKEVTKAGDKERMFEAVVSNVGDNIIEGTVTLALANIQTANEEKFNPVKIAVYPGATLVVKLSIPNKLAKGKYALAAILDYGHRQPLGGTQMLLEVK